MPPYQAAVYTRLPEASPCECVDSLHNGVDDRALSIIMRASVSLNVDRGIVFDQVASARPNEPGSLMDISVIIVNWNTRDLLRRCLDSLVATAGSLAVEVIVVDNDSHDGSQDMLRADYPFVTLIQNSVLGKDMLHSYPPVYVPAAGTAERGVCVPRG